MVSVQHAAMRHRVISKSSGGSSCVLIVYVECQNFPKQSGLSILAARTGITETRVFVYHL